MDEVHLSVVAASRNDNHGGDLLSRTQYFVTGFIEQTKRHGLNAELILVDWNPPEEKAPLSEVLKLPEDLGPCKVRFITVPKNVHDTFKHGKNLPLYQMIAKNVGIRRARGKYVLATNIDILFSDSLIQYLRDQLEPGYFYRTDRLDVPSKLPPLDCMDTLLDFCQKNYFRVNGRSGTKVKIDGEWICPDNRSPILSRFQKLLKMKPTVANFQYLLQKAHYRFLSKLHTNACGDFTLLSAKDWNALNGYPEIDGFSWHLDSLLISQAYLMGIRQKELSLDTSVYHIEHQKGSGYTPEDPDLVFKRVKAQKIPFLDNQAFLREVSLIKKKIYTYNKNNWGLSDHTFQEVSLS